MGKMAKSNYNWLGWLISPISTIIFKYMWLIIGIELNKYISLLWSISCLGWFAYYDLGVILGNKLIEKKFNIKK